MSPAAKTFADAAGALWAAVGSTPDTANHCELMLYRHCREGRGSQAALCFAGETYSYGQIAEQAARCNAWLRSLGVAPGDRIIVILPDCPALASTYFGIVAAGAIAVIIDPALSAEDAFYIAQLCEARLAIVHEISLARFLALRSVGGMIGVTAAGLSWTAASELSAATCRQDPDYVVSRNSGGHAYGLLSSGSTGRPKLIVHRHEDILYGYFGFAKAVVGLTAADRVISVAKISTGYGLGCSLLMPFLAGASSILVSEAPRAAVVTDAIKAHASTLLFAQPRFLADAIAAPDVSGALESVRSVITGGEPLADTIVDRWRRICGVELLDSYGNTEVGFLYITNRPREVRQGSVGRPIEGVDVEVTDNAGNTVPPGQVGKLRVRGPMVIGGYWNDPARTLESFQDGWFVTSDMFSIDADGYYYIHGRSDHLIKLGCGDWVNPVELERALLANPAVRECAVTGAPDDRGLTVLQAFIVPSQRAPAGEALAAELSGMIRDRWPLEQYKRIGIVEFLATLPKTAAGKLDRAGLGPQSMTEFSYKC
jgi:acyl-coenzyme A synthetase/AMP-(fatty) acid ligase